MRLEDDEKNGFVWQVKTWLWESLEGIGLF